MAEAVAVAVASSAARAGLCCAYVQFLLLYEYLEYADRTAELRRRCGCTAAARCLSVSAFGWPGRARPPRRSRKMRRKTTTYKTFRPLIMRLPFRRRLRASTTEYKIKYEYLIYEIDALNKRPRRLRLRLRRDTSKIFTHQHPRAANQRRDDRFFKVPHLTRTDRNEKYEY